MFLFLELRIIHLFILETQYGLIVRNVNKTSSMPGLMHSMGNMQNFYHFAVTVYSFLLPPPSPSFPSFSFIPLPLSAFPSSPSSHLASLSLPSTLSLLLCVYLMWLTCFLSLRNPLRFHQRKYLNSRYRFMAAELDTTFVLCKFDNEEARSYCALTVPNNVFDARALQADVMD